MIRDHPFRGEGQRDFLGESEGSPPPPPQDSLPDAGEAINDLWSMSGNFKNLKYIDVSRTTHANLDVKQEKRIDDYWDVDGSRDLSDFLDRFHSVHCIRGETSRRIHVVREETDKTASNIQARSIVARALE